MTRHRRPRTRTTPRHAVDDTWFERQARALLHPAETDEPRDRDHPGGREGAREDSFDAPGSE